MLWGISQVKAWAERAPACQRGRREMTESGGGGSFGFAQDDEIIFLKTFASFAGSWRRRLSCGVMEIVSEVTTLMLRRWSLCNSFLDQPRKWECSLAYEAAIWGCKRLKRDCEYLGAKKILNGCFRPVYRWKTCKYFLGVKW